MAKTIVWVKRCGSCASLMCSSSSALKSTRETLKAQGLLVEYKDGMNPRALLQSHVARVDRSRLRWPKNHTAQRLSDGCSRCEEANPDALLCKARICKMDIPAKKLRSDLEGGYVWLDFWSVPQEDPIAQRRSIDSIDQYVARAAYFSVLAGAWKHADDGSVRDQRAWCGRGWCRPELLANASVP